MRNHRVLFFALTTPTKQVQWALFCFLEPAQKIFLKKCGNLAKKIRQRESEKAISLPGTLKISFCVEKEDQKMNEGIKDNNDVN